MVSIPGITPALGLKGMPILVALQQSFSDSYAITRDDASHTPQTLNNCADFLKAEGHIDSAGSDLDYRALLHEGARCDALELLSHARPAPNGPFAKFSFAALKLKNLPPQIDLLIANESLSEAKKIAARGGSVLAIEPSLRLHKNAPYESDLEAKDWSGSLIDYGHADLYGDGGDELLLLRTAQAKGGTYAATDFFVLKQDGNRPLRLVDQRPHLSPPATFHTQRRLHPLHSNSVTPVRWEEMEQLPHLRTSEYRT